MLKMDDKRVTMEKLTNLCKRRGYIYPSCELYGGFANTYTYGPYGAELKNNIKNLWWKYFVQSRSDIVGIDGTILLHPKVWEASGHVGGFNDAMVDCKSCKARFRADQLIEEVLDIDTEGKPLEFMDEIIEKNKIKCPKCGNSGFTNVRKFNMMFKTNTGTTKDDDSIAYLRPETAQAIFMTFKNIADTMRVKIPFGIAQAGKSFRNEITPGNFIYRMIEFEIMEIEYFIEKNNWQSVFENWQKDMWDWCTKVLKIDEKNIKIYEHPKEKLSHYSSKTIDILYNYPFGFKELYGLAYRTDFDLKSHAECSGKSTEYFDQAANNRYIPHVIEPTFGLDRSVLITMLEFYDEEEAPTAEGGSEKRIVMRLPHNLAPVKIAVMPLSKKTELTEPTIKIFKELNKYWTAEYDETQSIGRRYRRQDEIGTPFVITYDFESINDNHVTIRERDSMKQIRHPIEKLKDYFSENLKIEF
jgi:glycyl-tRNA synthetase